MAILLSGFISLSLTPMMASRFLRPPHATRGYAQLFAQHVTQANEGCDFDFLHGAGGVAEPAIH